MIAAALCSVLLNVRPPTDSGTVIVVVGAPGTDEFAAQFKRWADRWQTAAGRGACRCVRLEGVGGDKLPDKKRLREAIEAHVRRGARPLWLVLIGHGTFDGRTARFNLVGPDVSGKELNDWLKPISRTAVVNCASASAPFINRVSAKGRVVVTATKSGAEHNFARFGGYMSEAIGNADADLDKDGQTSLLEAWLIAARRTQDFYKENGRLATEHALLDDNGDARGTRYDAFRGLRPTAKGGNGSLDGFRAHQWILVKGVFERQIPPALAAKRDELEMAVIQLREQREKLTEDEYYAELEKLLRPLSELYRELEREAAAKGETSGG